MDQELREAVHVVPKANHNQSRCDQAIAARVHRGWCPAGRFDDCGRVDRSFLSQRRMAVADIGSSDASSLMGEVVREMLFLNRLFESCISHSGCTERPAESAPESIERLLAMTDPTYRDLGAGNEFGAQVHRVVTGEGEC